jgi:hypothetical protein
LSAGQIADRGAWLALYVRSNNQKEDSMQVKGTAVQTIPPFIKTKFGELGFQKWLQTLTPRARTMFSSDILAPTWYPLRKALVDPTVKLCDVFYQGGPDGALEQGRFSAEHGLKGVYKPFVKMASPDSFVSKASTIMPTYYQPCAMEVVDKGLKTATLRITRFEAPHAVVEQRIKGWIERALELSGAKMARTQIKASMTQGSPYTDFAISWS